MVSKDEMLVVKNITPEVGVGLMDRINRNVRKFLKRII